VLRSIDGTAHVDRHHPDEACPQGSAVFKRFDTAKGFEVLPRRWVVERTFAWLGRNRRLAKDFEETIESSTAWLLMASVQLMTRRIASRWSSVETL
jgi:transposase